MYLAIFAACWVTGYVGVRVRNDSVERRNIAHLRERGASDENIATFLATVNEAMSRSKRDLIELWGGFFFGSMLGAVASGVYWFLG